MMNTIKIILLVSLAFAFAIVVAIATPKATPSHHLIAYHETHCVVEKYWSDGSVSKVIRPGRECDGYAHDIARY